MSFWKRAAMSIFRQPVKSVVLLLLVFVLGTVSLGAISVTTAIENTDRAIRRRMSPIVNIQLPQENIPYEETSDGGRIYHIDLVEPITSDMIQQIAELPYVRHHYYSMSNRLYTYDFDYYFAPFAHIIGSGSGQITLGNGQTIFFQQGNFFQFYGTSDDEPIAMQEGVIELVAGGNFEDFHIQSEDDLFPALVSSAFAGVNGLTVGSTFVMGYEFLIMDLFDWDADDPDISEMLWYFPYEFEIVGLFEVVPTANVIPRGYEDVEGQRVSDLSNRIHVPNEVMTIIHEHALEEYQRLYEAYGIEWWTLEEADNDIVNFQSFFILNDPLELEQFREAALEILPELWDFDDLSNTFEAVASSFETMRGISNGILRISTGATVLILTLIILLFLRDRHHEVGIYLALGEGRKKIILQILTEVIVIAFIGITAAIFIGNVISGMMSREMLRTELAQQPSQVTTAVLGSWGQNDTLFHMGFGAELTVEETLEIFEISLSTESILIFYVVGLGTTLVATVIPILYVVRLNPKKILMQGRIR